MHAEPIVRQGVFVESIDRREDDMPGDCSHGRRATESGGFIKLEAWENGRDAFS